MFRHRQHRPPAANLRHRPGRAAANPRRARAARVTRSRRKLPRSLRRPRSDARQARHPHAQRIIPRPATRPANRALGSRAAKHPSHRALASARVLEILRSPGRAGPAMRVHARLLQARPHLRAGRLSRHDRRRMAAPSGKQRPRPRPLHRRIRGPAAPAELPGRPHGPRHHPGRPPPYPPPAGNARNGAVHRRRNPAGPASAERRRATGLRLSQRRHLLPPDRHRAHGAPQPTQPP